MEQKFQIPNSLEEIFQNNFHMSFLDNKEVGKRLKIKREQGGRSSRQFALDANVDVSQYSKIEKGELPITPKILSKLAKAHELDESYILYGTNAPHDNKEAKSSKLANKSIAHLTAEQINESLLKSNLDLSAAILNQSEANKLQGEANRTQSEANLISARNQERAIELLKVERKSTTESALPKPSAYQLENFSDLLRVIASVGATAKHWRDEEEGLKELNKFVLAAAEGKSIANIVAG
jgi:transcriptional regulator with XRE-family HTH domain